MSRKKALKNRAERHARSYYPSTCRLGSSAVPVDAFDAFEAGYRAAMRDARKAFHEGRHSGNVFYLAAPMVKFLRSLRQ